MYCSKCGAKNEDTSSFCSGCGNPLKKTNTPITAQQNIPRASIMETKIEEIPGKDAVQKRIDELGVFSWGVKSIQKVDVKDSHLENSGGNLYNVTERNTYYSITFERDTASSWYKEIRSLEIEYFTLIHSPTPFQQCAVDGFEVWEIILYISFFPFSLIPLFNKKSKIKKQKQYFNENRERLQKEYDKKMARCNEIIEIARNLPYEYMNN